MRAARKVMVAAAVAVAFCAVAGAALAIPAHAQSLENPARPSNLAATSTSSTVTLTWDNPGDSTITGYKILSRITATESILTVLVSDTGSAGTSYTVRGLEPDATYQFAVLAVNNAGNSAPSQIVTVSTGAQTAPPSDTTALASIIESLTGIIEGLSLKITALEAEIVDLRGTLGGRIVAPVTDSGDFVPVYYAATSQHNLAQKSHYEDQLFLENLTGRLTQTLALPYDVYLTMDECGEPEAVYYPYYARIVLCYEFVTFLEGRLAPYYGTNAELSRGVSDFVTWVMLSELGRALIDVYDLPVTGNEEDAVDQFATVIALEYIPPDQAGNVLSSTLRAWSLGQNDVSLPEPHPIGSDPLASHRLHKVACWIYGSDVHAFSNFVDSGLLTEARAGQCPSEYERMSESWYRLAGQFLIKGDPVIRLNGASEVGLNVGDPYTEAGATCTDAKGVTLEVARTSDAPDTTRAGTYTLEYSCTGAAGNTATATRVVTVGDPAAPDTDAPVITVNDGTDTITAGGQWTDAGAACVDARDGTLTVTISGTVDNTRAGTYTITYRCTDNASNSATETRTVTVNARQATISLNVVPGDWDNGVLELAISGTAANVADGTVTVTSDTIPNFGEHDVPVSNNAISGEIIFVDVTVHGTHTFTATSSDGAATGSDTANIPLVLTLSSVTPRGVWFVDPNDNQVKIELIVRGTESVSSPVDLSVLNEDGTTSVVSAGITLGDKNEARFNMTDTDVQGPTQFVLTATYAGVTAASNSRTTNMPVLLELDDITVGEWDGSNNLVLTVTGSKKSIVGNDINLQIRDAAGDFVTTGLGADAVAGRDDGAVAGTVPITDISVSGDTQFRLTTADNAYTSKPITKAVPPILVLDSISMAGTWSGDRTDASSLTLSLRVSGSEGVSGTSVDLYVNGVDSTEDVTSSADGSIGTTVSFGDITISGPTEFQLASTSGGNTATSQNMTLNIPPILTLTSVATSGTWEDGSIDLSIVGTALSTESLALTAPDDGVTIAIPTTGENSIVNDQGVISGTVTLTNVAVTGDTVFRLQSGDGSTDATSRDVTVNIPPVLTLTSVSPRSWTGTVGSGSIPLAVEGTSGLPPGTAITLRWDNAGTYAPLTPTIAVANDGSIFGSVSFTTPAAANSSHVFNLVSAADANGNTAASNNVTQALPAFPVRGNSVDVVPMPMSFSNAGFPLIIRAVIGDISEIPAVHTVQMTQPHQTLAMLMRSVVIS